MNIGSVTSGSSGNQLAELLTLVNPDGKKKYLDDLKKAESAYKAAAEEASAKTAELRKQESSTKGQVTKLEKLRADVDEKTAAFDGAKAQLDADMKAREEALRVERELVTLRERAASELDASANNKLNKAQASESHLADEWRKLNAEKERVAGLLVKIQEYGSQL